MVDPRATVGEEAEATETTATATATAAIAGATITTETTVTIDDATGPDPATEMAAGPPGIETAGATGPGPATGHTVTGEVGEIVGTAVITILGGLEITTGGAPGAMERRGTGMVSEVASLA